MKQVTKKLIDVWLDMWKTQYSLPLNYYENVFITAIISHIVMVTKTCQPSKFKKQKHLYNMHFQCYAQFCFETISVSNNGK